MATNRFLVVAKYAVGSNRGLKDVELVDTRVQGGGIKEDLVETFKGAYPQVRWFHNIGHYDGTPFPGATAVLVDLPASVLEVNGGILTKKQIESIVKHHLSFGVYPVIRFYCTNTGLIMHEDVLDSTGAGTWNVPEGKTCPDLDGTVLCVFEPTTTSTTTTTTTTTVGGVGIAGDDFDDGSIGVQWTQDYTTNGSGAEASSQLTLDSGDGWFHLYGTTPNWIYQENITGDFDVKLKIDAENDIAHQYHDAGLLIWQDATHYAWIGLSYFTGPGDLLEPRVRVGGDSAGNVAFTSARPIYVRIKRVGSTMSWYWSTDGSSWTPIDPSVNYWTSTDPVSIGIQANHGNQAQFTVSFDWILNF